MENETKVKAESVGEHQKIRIEKGAKILDSIKADLGEYYVHVRPIAQKLITHYVSVRAEYELATTDTDRAILADILRTAESTVRKLINTHNIVFTNAFLEKVLDAFTKAVKQVLLAGIAS